MLKTTVRGASKYEDGRSSFLKILLFASSREILKDVFLYVMMFQRPSFVCFECQKDVFVSYRCLSYIFRLLHV